MNEALRRTSLVPRVDRAAPLQFLRTAFDRDDWIALLLKRYDAGEAVQHVGPARLFQQPDVHASLRVMHARRFNLYLAWNWGACFLLFWRQCAPCSHGAARVSEEEEVRMPEHDVRWGLYPTVASEPTARAWLSMQAGRNLARHTVDTDGRSGDRVLLNVRQVGAATEGVPA